MSRCCCLHPKKYSYQDYESHYCPRKPRASLQKVGRGCDCVLGGAGREWNTYQREGEGIASHLSTGWSQPSHQPLLDLKMIITRLLQLIRKCLPLEIKRYVWNDVNNRHLLAEIPSLEPALLPGVDSCLRHRSTHHLLDRQTHSLDSGSWWLYCLQRTYLNIEK